VFLGLRLSGSGFTLDLGLLNGVWGVAGGWVCAGQDLTRGGVLTRAGCYWHKGPLRYQGVRMVNLISKLINPPHGLWRVDELVTHLRKQNKLSSEAATEIETAAYRAIHSGALKSHDPLTSLHVTSSSAYTPIVSLQSFSQWLLASGIQVKLKAPRRKITQQTKTHATKGIWKMQIQAEAAQLFKRLRASRASPTVHSILPTIVQWCRTNNVKTDGGIFPSEGYLRTHVLGARHWSPPP
jgi:hypothetical protein